MPGFCSFILAAFLAIALAAGCGGDDPAPGTCEATGTAVCDQACACSTDGTCQIVSGGVRITHQNYTDCTFFWVGLGCPPEEDTVDYVACEAALEAPVCVETADGTALEFPLECGDA